PAQAPFGEIDLSPGDAGVGRAEERVQILSVPAEPGEPEERDQRVPERRAAERNPPLGGVWDAERPEDRVERRAVALEGRADHADSFEVGPAPPDLEHGLAHQLERAAGSRALEKADRARER